MTRSGGIAYATSLPGGFRVGIWIEIQEEAPVAREIAIDHPDGTPVTTTVLRHLYVDQQLAKWSKELRQLYDKQDAETQRRWGRLRSTRPALRNVSRRPGPRGHLPSFYAEVAYEYLKVLRAGSPRPVEDLARELGWTVTRTRDAITAARKQQLLTKAPKGRPGGQLTEAGWEVLDKLWKRDLRPRRERLRKAGKKSTSKRKGAGR